MRCETIERRGERVNAVGAKHIHYKIVVRVRRIKVCCECYTNSSVSVRTMAMYSRFTSFTAQPPCRHLLNEYAQFFVVVVLFCTAFVIMILLLLLLLWLSFVSLLHCSISMGNSSVYSAVLSVVRPNLCTNRKQKAKTTNAPNDKT